MVEVQKLEVFCDFCGARATLCGDRRGRGSKTRGFLRFLRCSRNPLRGSWSRCKNPWFFAISAVLARPSARIGRGAKTHGFLRRNPLRGSAWSRCKNPCFFCDFCGARATLCGDRRGRGATFFCSNWSSRVVSWFARLLPEPAGRGFDSSLVRGRASQDATCILKQLAQSNLRRASCTEQLAQTNLHRPVCAQSALPRATCARRATYAEQLAQSNLRRAPCLVLSRACFTNASCREKERILQRWADLACDVLLSGQPWSSYYYFFCGGGGEGRPEQDRPKWRFPRNGPLLVAAREAKRKPPVLLLPFFEPPWSPSDGLAQPLLPCSFTNCGAVVCQHVVCGKVPDHLARGDVAWRAGLCMQHAVGHGLCFNSHAQCCECNRSHLWEVHRQQWLLL